MGLNTSLLIFVTLIGEPFRVACYLTLCTYFSLCSIVWDCPELVERIWERCLLANGISEELGRIADQPGIQGYKAVDRGDKWKFAKLNERMRFLRYGAGNYFKSELDLFSL